MTGLYLRSLIAVLSWLSPRRLDTPARRLDADSCRRTDAHSPSPRAASCDPAPEEALLESAAFTRATVDALTSQIAILDEHGMILAVNRAWREFFQGTDAATACAEGADYLRICEEAAAAGDEDSARAADALHALLAEQRLEFCMEYSSHARERQQWFLMRVTRFPGGGPARLVLEREEITERKRAEAMEREQAVLREAVSAMERVLAVVGHELRTPLAGLRAMTEFLLTDGACSSDESSRFLRNMEAEVIRMSDTVNNILEAARLNSGRARWNWSQFNPAEPCHAALAGFAAVAPEVELLFEHFRACDREPALMNGDVDALRRLVVNLVSNALKHTPRGSVRVSIRFAEDWTRWVHLTVSDTGLGIPPDIIQKLGQPFALNAGVAGKNHIGGTGLGLAICKGIVAAHGGELSIQSELGRGTTVTARLRADLPEPAGESDMTFASETINGRASSDDRGAGVSSPPAAETAAPQRNLTHSSGVAGD